MAELKREYVIPLRRETLKAPKWRRSKKAMSVIRAFIKRHMKADKVVIGRELNEKVWERGIKNPPGKVEVIALRKEFNNEPIAFVNLKDADLDVYIVPYESSSVEDMSSDVKDVVNKESSSENKVEKEEKSDKNSSKVEMDSEKTNPKQNDANNESNDQKKVSNEEVSKENIKDNEKEVKKDE